MISAALELRFDIASTALQLTSTTSSQIAYSKGCYAVCACNWSLRLWNMAWRRYCPPPYPGSRVGIARYMTAGHRRGMNVVLGTGDEHVSVSPVKCGLPCPWHRG